MMEFAPYMRQPFGTAGALRPYVGAELASKGSSFTKINGEVERPSRRTILLQACLGIRIFQFTPIPPYWSNFATFDVPAHPDAYVPSNCDLHSESIAGRSRYHARTIRTSFELFCLQIRDANSLPRAMGDGT